MEKVKCFTMRLPGSSKLIDPEIKNILATLRIELEENNEDGETLEFEFGIEYYTQDELDEMEEFDGF